MGRHRHKMQRPYSAPNTMPDRRQQPRDGGGTVAGSGSVATRGSGLVAPRPVDVASPRKADGSTPHSQAFLSNSFKCYGPRPAPPAPQPAPSSCLEVMPASRDLGLLLVGRLYHTTFCLVNRSLGPVRYRVEAASGYRSQAAALRCVRSGGRVAAGMKATVLIEIVASAPGDVDCAFDLFTDDRSSVRIHLAGTVADNKSFAVHARQRRIDWLPVLDPGVRCISRNRADFEDDASEDDLPPPAPGADTAHDDEGAAAAAAAAAAASAAAADKIDPRELIDEADYDDLIDAPMFPGTYWDSRTQSLVMDTAQQVWHVDAALPLNKAVAVAGRRRERALDILEGRSVAVSSRSLYGALGRPLAEAAFPVPLTDEQKVRVKAETEAVRDNMERAALAAREHAAGEGGAGQ